MAFTQLTLQIDTIMQSDFVPDAFTKANSNFVEIQSIVEDLVNQLEIDLTNKKIGTDNPINLLRTENIILKGGTLVYQSSVGTQVASLTLNGSNESIFNVDHLVIDSSITTASISASGLSAITNLTVSGTSAFSGKSTFTISPAYTPQTVPVELVYNTSTNYAEGEIILTNSSRKHSYLELVCDAATYSAGAFNPLINGIKLKITLHVSTPPVDGSELMLALYRLVSGSTNITATYAALSKPMDLIPNSLLAIQDNAPGTLGSPIRFENVGLRSNITFAKNTFNSQSRLIIISSKNMI